MKLYKNTFKNIQRRDNFLSKYALLNWIQEETEMLKRPVTLNKLETLKITFKKASGLDGVTPEIYLNFK